MEKPRRKQVRHAAIAGYWGSKVDETELNVDWSEALTHCWGCGYKKKLQGAHIIPHCLGGESAPSNMVLLCSKCNRDNPHSNLKDEFWKWIKAKRNLNIGGLYNTSREIEIFMKYEETYSCNLVDELSEIFNEDYKRYSEELKKFAEDNKNKYYMNNLSTKVVFYKDFVLNMKNKSISVME